MKYTKKYLKELLQGSFGLKSYANFTTYCIVKLLSETFDEMNDEFTSKTESVKNAVNVVYENLTEKGFLDSLLEKENYLSFVKRGSIIY